jgi:hypothetical protein
VLKFGHAGVLRIKGVDQFDLESQVAQQSADLQQAPGDLRQEQAVRLDSAFKLLPVALPFLNREPFDERVKPENSFQ